MIQKKPEFHAGTYIATNMLTNLCETCGDSFGECTPEILEFGYGIGNDNVVKCEKYSGVGNCDIVFCD